MQKEKQMNNPISALMAIFGYKRKAVVRDNVIYPVIEIQCGVCGETHPGDNIPFNCEKEIQTNA